MASKSLVYILPGMRFKTGMHRSQLSLNEDIANARKNDPLVHNKISIKLYQSLNKAGQAILRNKHKINVPLLLMHGTKDQVTASKSTKKFARDTSERTHLKLWETSAHELHNDNLKDEVFHYIMDWLHNEISNTG
jgi:alpha-beta hydrolase superfamily lysophospholipase